MNVIAKRLSQLNADEAGVIQPAMFLLFLTILVLGIIPGLATLRNHITQEFGDAAVALQSIDQSYSMTINGTVSQYIDSNSLTDPDGSEPACLDIDQVAGTPEG